MTTWPSTSLGDIADIAVGPAFKSADFTDNPAAVRLLRGINIGVGEIKWGATKYWPVETAADYDRFQLRQGDVVLAMDRPWIDAGLKVASVRASDTPALLVQRVARLRAREACDQGFIRALVSAPEFREHLRGITTGTAVPHISADDINEFKLSLPTLPTQRRIAAVLSAFDELIEINERRIELLEDLARSLYREWFVHFRFPGHEGVEMVDSELGPIPEGWSVTRLGNNVGLDKGLSYKGAYLTGAGTPMANLKCFAPSGGFRRTGTKPYSGPFKARHAISPGDLVIANTDLTQAGNVIGRPAIVPTREFEDGGMISHHLFAVRPADGPTVPFLYEMLAHERFRAFARARASGTTVLGLRAKDAIEFPMVSPSLEILGVFSTAASTLHRQAEHLSDAIEDLAHTRDLLLPRLVTGRLDISDVDLGILTPVEPE